MDIGTAIETLAKYGIPVTINVNNYNGDVNQFNLAEGAMLAQGGGATINAQRVTSVERNFSLQGPAGSQRAQLQGQQDRPSRISIGRSAPLLLTTREERQYDEWEQQYG